MDPADSKKNEFAAQQQLYPILCPVNQSCELEDKHTKWEALIFQNNKNEYGLIDWNRRFSGPGPSFSRFNIRSHSLKDENYIFDTEERFGSTQRPFTIGPVATSSVSSFTDSREDLIHRYD